MNNPLLELYLNKLKLTVIASQYGNVIDKNSKSDIVTILTKLFELEVQTREEKAIGRKLKGANFPKVKTLDSFNFTQLPKLDKQKILDFANCEFIEKAQNIIMLGNAGTGKTHLAIAIGVAACQKNISVYFTSAAKLANDLMEARDEYSLSRLHNKLAKHKLLIIDEIGYVPLSNTGAELMYDIINQRYESCSLIMTTNLQFSDWVQVFKSDKLTSALLDRITHYSNIIEMNGDSYRFNNSIAKTT
jgi:DNA replication protein DnaC